VSGENVFAGADKDDDDRVRGSIATLDGGYVIDINVLTLIALLLVARHEGQLRKPYALSPSCVVRLSQRMYVNRGKFKRGMDVGL